MITVFIYEFLTGGGLLNGASAREAPASLLAEGRAMASALAADWVALGFVKAVAMRDRRLATWKPGASRVVDVSDGDEHAAAFDRLAAEADWTVVIAPEIGGALAERCRRVATVGGRLLGPPTSLVELASDKHATIEFLTAAGVPAPRGVLFPPGAAWPREFDYPAVFKPLDGAGSHDVAYVPSADAPLLARDESPGRLERFCPGAPASVAFLCGPGGSRLALPPCRQRLSGDGRFRYLGGELPLPAELASRATAVAERAVSALPGAFGYLGVDLVLGEAADGADDVVIEINPRLTTSYIGLRAAVEENLAGAMLRIAQGFASPPRFIVSQAVQFDADGSVRRSSFPH